MDHSPVRSGVTRNHRKPPTAQERSKTPSISSFFFLFLLDSPIWYVLFATASREEGNERRWLSKTSRVDDTRNYICTRADSISFYYGTQRDTMDEGLDAQVGRGSCEEHILHQSHQCTTGSMVASRAHPYIHE